MAHGLSDFDGTHCTIMRIRRKDFTTEWNSAIFNYGRNEVRKLSDFIRHYSGSTKYHIDGIRVDAVASMLYLDYARKHANGFRTASAVEESGTIEFLPLERKAVYRDHPDATMIAEESTAWPMVSRPTTMGGLGFGLKWNMGWIHDTLEYISRIPVSPVPSWELTFSLIYAFNETSSCRSRMTRGGLWQRVADREDAGGDWQMFANLRALMVICGTSG